MRIIGPALFSWSVVGVGFIAAVAAILFFAWLAEEMLEGDTMVFDNAVRAFVHEHSSEALTTVMRAFTFVGSTIFLGILTSIVLLVFVVGRHWWSTVVFGVMMSGAILLNFVLKTSFARDRPTTYFDTPVPDSYSFPSGHALFSLCFYVSLAWILTRHLNGVWHKGHSLDVNGYAGRRSGTIADLFRRPLSERRNCRLYSRLDLADRGYLSRQVAFCPLVA
jgi:hypothetical protein